jgi:hypothetical protein
MKERPILMSAPMVRAILAGTKTQTRRVVKWLPLRLLDESGFSPDFVAHPENALCPYGQPGARLWVRETHMDLGACYLYRADESAERERALVAPGQRWRPAIHMPRAMSRITLEVTAARIERLQDISAEDARAEGISEFVGGWWCEHDDAEQVAGMTPQEGYRHLWERINGAGSWDANPWVWVVEFDRAEGRS